MSGQVIVEKPADVDALRALLLDRRELFTPKMLAAGAFAIENPQVLALNPVSEVARIAGLAPTSFVRLAQAMGFAGFSEMQALFRAPLRRAIPPTLGERIRHALGEQVVADPDDPAALGRSFAEANIASLRHLADRMDALPLDGAINLITGARMIYVIGVDRSFPTAAYLSYALNRAGLQSVQIVGLGRARAPHAAGRGRGAARFPLADRGDVPCADAGDGGGLSPATRRRRARHG
jgi:DNA-binding MurR/RpiR family transcriptional regulator